MKYINMGEYEFREVTIKITNTKVHYYNEDRSVDISIDREYSDFKIKNLKHNPILTIIGELEYLMDLTFEDCQLAFIHFHLVSLSRLYFERCSIGTMNIEQSTFLLSLNHVDINQLHLEFSITKVVFEKVAIDLLTFIFLDSVTFDDCHIKDIYGTYLYTAEYLKNVNIEQLYFFVKSVFGERLPIKEAYISHEDGEYLKIGSNNKKIEDIGHCVVDFFIAEGI